MEISVICQPYYAVSYKSVEPSENIFINTDFSGAYFPEKYIVYIYDEEMPTPSGTKITEVMDDWDVFQSDTELLEAFHRLGYEATTFKELTGLLDEDEIQIHEFENPYASENAA